MAAKHLKLGVSMKRRKSAIVVIIKNSQMAVTSTKFWNFFHLRKNLRTLKNDFYFFKHPLLFFEGLFPCCCFTWIFLYTIFRRKKTWNASLVNLVPVAFWVLGLSNAGKYGGHDCPLAALQRQEGGNTLTATPCPDLQLK